MKKRDWGNMSNGRIKESLLEISHEQESIKNKIVKLLENKEFLTKEFLIGNNTITKRMKGED